MNSQAQTGGRSRMNSQAQTGGRSRMTMFHRPEAGVVTVEGPDAITYLQSLVSQDLDPLGDGEWTRSLLLQPQGKLTAFFDLLRVSPEQAVLVTDEGYGSV